MAEMKARYLICLCLASIAGTRQGLLNFFRPAKCAISLAGSANRENVFQFPRLSSRRTCEIPILLRWQIWFHYNSTDGTSIFLRPFIPFFVYFSISYIVAAGSRRNEIYGRCEIPNEKALYKVFVIFQNHMLYDGFHLTVLKFY